MAMVHGWISNEEILLCEVNTTYCWFPWKFSPVTVPITWSVQH